MKRSALLVVATFLSLGFAHATTTPLPTGMTFVEIPGGTFEMGCVEGFVYCKFHNMSSHQVTLSPYEIMTTEVTGGMWREVIDGEDPSTDPKKYDSYPVSGVSWDEAQAFIERLNERFDGWFYHLPTEAQWEYAARAGTKTLYSSGNFQWDLKKVGWYRDNSGYSTQPVGLLKPNRFGLYDMHGNVNEWVLDWLDDYPTSPQKDPFGPSEPKKYRVLRGGSAGDGPISAQSGYRNFQEPRIRNGINGFRLARTRP